MNSLDTARKVLAGGVIVAAVYTSVHAAVVWNRLEAGLWSPSRIWEHPTGAFVFAAVGALIVCGAIASSTPGFSPPARATLGWLFLLFAVLVLWAIHRLLIGVTSTGSGPPTWY